MAESAPAERREQKEEERSRTHLGETPRFEVLGYGAACTVCGSLVAGAGSQELHRRHHRALAVLGRPDPP